ncbi:MAG: hypothetical protein ACREJQ_03720, partial [bacterium]
MKPFKMAEFETSTFRGGKPRNRDLSLRILHSRDQGDAPEVIRKRLKTVPDEIVQPTNIEEIAEVLREAYARGRPVVPQAGRSFALGGAVPMRGGVA